ncbi:MAG: TetR family transcriptional regulator [Planctomycetaceae bacterium]|jgi:AcrR family transcriptional regulator|nr:TetR family transcriptional regulator [Planctomycetaceae bacterium]
MSESRRDQIIETAMKLFCRDGFHATGVDAVVQASGVAKMTLYRHFKSKDELILAAIRRSDERFRHWFMTELEARASDPAGRLMRILDLVDECIHNEEFSGCPFILASGEFSEPDHPVNVAVAEHTRLLHRYVSGIAAEAGVADPDSLTIQICLLAEGVFVQAHLGRKDVVAQARAAAETLIRHATAGVAAVGTSMTG